MIDFRLVSLLPQALQALKKYPEAMFALERYVIVVAHTQSWGVQCVQIDRSANGKPRAMELDPKNTIAKFKMATVLYTIGNDAVRIA